MTLAVLLLALCLLLSTANGRPIQTPEGLFLRGQSQQTVQRQIGFKGLFNEIYAEHTSGSLFTKKYLWIVWLMGCVPRERWTLERKVVS